MTLSDKQKRKDFRAVFDLLDREPRIKYTEIARILDVDIRIASSRLKEAIEKGYIIGPQIRKKSFSNLRSHVSFIDCDDPLDMYQRCMEDENVIYHAVLDGFCNFQVISQNPMNTRDSVLEGVLPDYFLSHPPDHPWGTAINTMQDMVAQFTSEDYTPKHYITNHWDEAVEWNEEHEILYQELKYNLRKPFMHIVSKYSMWRGKVYDFLENLPEYCTIFTCYYRESLSAYEAYVYTFETDYEDFIIDVFSELPTTCWFYRVGDRLVVHVRVMAEPSNWEDIPIQDVSELQIPFLVKELLKREIVKSENHATFKYHWKKEERT